MIVVTGATGTLNGATVAHLLERVPASEIGVSVRDPAKAQHLADRGVRVRQATYDDPGALRDSFAGAQQVLLVSSSDLGADVVTQHRNAIDAAVAAGAERILYTSQYGADPDSPYQGSVMHAASEAHLAESGVAWTSLRNGFYGSTSQLLGPWQETGEIAMPADGPFSWVDRADVGEAAAVILTGDRPLDGPHDLVSTDPVTLEDFARHASELTGRSIDRVVVDDEDWVDRQTAAGTPEPAARFALSMFQALRAGHFATTSPLLTELLGRAPRSARDLLADDLATES